MRTALTIAGSDSSGGAGIQADIKTMTALGVYATCAITALTAQDTTGVYGISDVEPSFIAKQLDCIFTDIYPDAVKIGMISRAGAAAVIAERLKFYGAKHIVVDPVMISTSGSRLIHEDAEAVLKEQLFGIASVITPNVPEAEVLSGVKIQNADDMIEAARILHEQYGCAVLCKGGHSINDANDLLYDDGGYEWFQGERIENPNTHGTGCTLSSAIAAGLAKGEDMKTAVRNAKDYITGALRSQLDLGKGSGPLDHMWKIEMI